MSKIESVIQKYMIEHYGDLIFADKPVFDKKTRTWKSQLRSKYPNIHVDKKNQERIVKFLDLRELGMIKLNEELQVIYATPREEVNTTITRFLRRVALGKIRNET